MTYQPTTISDDLRNLPQLPGWLTSGRAETLEDVAFLSSSALNYLHLVLARDDVPVALIRARLTLRAVEACVKFSGRPERAGELRDAVQVSHRASVSVTVRLPKAPIEIDILYHRLGLAHGDQTGTAFKRIDILKNRHNARRPSPRAIRTEACSGWDVLHKALSIRGVDGEKI